MFEKSNTYFCIMENLKNKYALVTGGSRGLGKAIAVALAEAGANVAITGRHESTLTEVVEELKSKGVKAAFAVFDVSNKEEIKKALAKLQEQTGSFDIVINNAGIAAFGSVLEMDEDAWEDIIQTNLFGPYYVTKAVLPGMIEKKTGGDIINIASTAGLKGGANTSAYSVSKAGLIALSESLMYEMRKNNIRVVTLNPSTIATSMSKDVLKITDGNPDKVLQPEDFAQFIVDVLQLKSRVLLANAALFSTNP